MTKKNYRKYRATGHSIRSHYKYSTQILDRHILFITILLIIFIYLLSSFIIKRCTGIMVRIVRRETGVHFQVESHLKTQKWYLIPPCLPLNIIRCGSKLSGAIHRKELRLPLYLSVEANEKGTFGSPTIMVNQLTNFIIFQKI